MRIRITGLAFAPIQYETISLQLNQIVAGIINEPTSNVWFGCEFKGDIFWQCIGTKSFNGWDNGRLHFESTIVCFDQIPVETIMRNRKICERRKLNAEYGFYDWRRLEIRKIRH